MEERHKYAKRKKRESLEKRAVFKERHKYAAQKKWKNMKKSSKIALLWAEILSRRPRATSAAGICIQNHGPSRQLFW